MLDTKNIGSKVGNNSYKKSENDLLNQALKFFSVLKDDWLSISICCCFFHSYFFCVRNYINV